MPSQPRPSGDRRPYMAPRSGDKRPSGSGERKFHKEGTSKPHTGSKQGPTSSTGATGGSKSPTCYKCGQVGHISTDPKCPLYQRNVRLHAGRLVEYQEPEGGEPNPGEDADDESDDNDVAQGQMAASQQDALEDDNLPHSDYGPLSDYPGGAQYSSSDDESTDNDPRRELFLLEMEPLPGGSDEYFENEPTNFLDAAERVVQSFQIEAQMPSRSIRNAWLYDSRIRQLKDASAQPKRDFAGQRPLCAEIKINGAIAYALFDSGCTTDSISPTFAYIAMADQVKLDEQMGLQLGARGSKTRINYGARGRLSVGTVNEDYYFDVVDIDKYDVILGTPFFLKHQVILDFRNRSVIVDGKPIPVYTAVDEAEMLRYRHERRKQRVTAQLHAALVSQTIQE